MIIRKCQEDARLLACNDMDAAAKRKLSRFRTMHVFGHITTTTHTHTFAHLVIACQGQKVIKSSFLGLRFSMSGAKARKLSNRASWDWPESHRIEYLVLSTSGAKARKSSNHKKLSMDIKVYFFVFP